MAIIYLEQRKERKARKILLDVGLDDSILREWIARPNQKLKRFSNVIYSPAVLKRLLALRLEECDDSSDSGASVRLSRMSISGGMTGGRARRQTGNFRDTISNHRVSRMERLVHRRPERVTCQYCMMTCSFLDYKCDPCTKSGKMVYYCTIECKRDHHSQHAMKCVKNNRQSMMLSVENLNSVVGSIMESKLSQSLFRAFKT